MTNCFVATKLPPSLLSLVDADFFPEHPQKFFHIQKHRNLAVHYRRAPKAAGSIGGPVHIHRKLDRIHDLRYQDSHRQTGRLWNNDVQFLAGNRQGPNREKSIEPDERQDVAAVGDKLMVSDPLNGFGRDLFKP